MVFVWMFLFLGFSAYAAEEEMQSFAQSAPQKQLSTPADQGELGGQPSSKKSQKISYNYDYDYDQVLGNSRARADRNRCKWCVIAGVFIVVATIVFLTELLADKDDVSGSGSGMSA